MAAHFKRLDNGHMSNGNLRSEILEDGRILFNHPFIHKVEFEGIYVCVYDFKGEFDKKPIKEFYETVLDNIKLFGGYYVESLLKKEPPNESYGVIDDRYGWYIAKSPPRPIKPIK